MAKVCAGRALTGTRQQQCQKRSSDIVSTMTVSDVDNRDRSRTTMRGYYRGAHDIIIVYDVADKESLNNAKVWMGEIDKHPDGVNKLLDGKQVRPDIPEGSVHGRSEGAPGFSEHEAPRDERQECTQR